MHAIHCAAACVCSDRGEEGRISDAKTDLLALHVAAGLRYRCPLIRARQQRIAARLRPVRRRNAGKKQQLPSPRRRPIRAVAIRSFVPACM